METTAASLPTSARTGYLRSPAQVAMLMVSTCGLYTFWWLGRNRWLAENRIGQPHRPIAAWTLIIVPIANAFVYYGALDVIQKGVRARRYAGPVPYWLYGLIGQATGLIFWFVPVMQIYIYEADLTEASSHQKPRLSAAEILVILVGFALEAVLILATASTDSDQALGEAILLVAAFPLIIFPFWLVTRRVNARVEQSRLTACPWCLSAIPKAAKVCRICHRDVETVV